MKNRGFTLIEMIAIVTILVAISLIVAPAIINTINDKSGKQKEAYLNNIYIAAENYMLNEDGAKDDLIKSKRYFITLDDLIRNNYIGSDVLNTTYFKINSSTKVSVIVNNDGTWRYEFPSSGFDGPAEIVFSVDAGTINSNGWAKNDFNVTVVGNNILNYVYCTGSTNCIPDITKKARDNKIRISNEGTTYVCAKGTNDAEETDVICESYKLDKTAPTIGTLNVNGNRGLNDWFVGDVTISYTNSTDELSGMDTNILNPSATKVTTDTAGTTYTLTAKDKAGNTSQVSYVVKRDTKAPNVGKALFNGLEYNANKWFNSNVTVSVVNGSDSTSGHFTTTTDVSTVTNQGSVNKVVLTTTDKAGNTSTRGYNIKLDKKAPTITARYLSITVGDIIETNVSDLFTATYSISGGSMKCDVEKTTDVRGIHNPLKCTATGGNGLSSTASIKVINPLIGITIASVPTKVDYKVGEAFDKTGMVVEAIYTDGSIANVTGYTTSMGSSSTDDKNNQMSTPYGINNLRPGKEQTVTISYTENGITKTATTKINTYIYGDQISNLTIALKNYGIEQVTSWVYVGDPGYTNPISTGTYNTNNNPYAHYTLGTNYIQTTTKQSGYNAVVNYNLYVKLKDGSYWFPGNYEKNVNYSLTVGHEIVNRGYGSMKWVGNVGANEFSGKSQVMTKTITSLGDGSISIASSSGTPTIKQTFSNFKVNNNSIPLVFIEMGG